MKTVSIEIAKKRFSICKNCVHNKFGMCMQCKCVLRLKVWIPESSCPFGFWKKELIKENGHDGNYE